MWSIFLALITHVALLTCEVDLQHYWFHMHGLVLPSEVYDLQHDNLGAIHSGLIAPTGLFATVFAYNLQIPQCLVMMILGSKIYG